MEILYEKQFTTVDDSWHDDDHLHDCYEIYINLSGDVSFRVRDRVYELKRGDVVLTRPNELHRCIYHTNCIHEHFCIWIKGLPVSYGEIEERLEKQNLIVLPEEDKEELIKHCFRLHQSRKQENELHFRVAHHFFGILDLICTGEQETYIPQSLPVRFAEILLYISRHFHEASFNVATLSNAFFISNSSLNRYFSRYFQTSPSLYIESCRFAEAKKLLCTGHSVQYTSFHCGFSDCPYFVKRFHKKFGITPLQYRKQFESETKNNKKA